MLIFNEILYLEKHDVIAIFWVSERLVLMFMLHYVSSQIRLLWTDVVGAQDHSHVASLT